MVGRRLTRREYRQELQRDYFGSVDWNDRHWSIETSFTASMGETSWGSPYHGTGIDYEGFEIECTPGGCGMQLDIPKCRGQWPNNYQGSGHVAIYHTISPDTHYKIGAVQQTTCDPPINHPSDECETDPPDPSCTPIVLDLDGRGFRFTDKTGGVAFDLNADGERGRTSWIARGSLDGLLALDRNGNGTIDDGTELFGGRTPQPFTGDRNGFEALAVFDSPDHGGNLDGFISSEDAIFTSLLVWIDRNHDGSSQLNELMPVIDAGVHRFDLRYRESQRRDPHGNLLRYSSRFEGPRGRHGGATVDVYFAARD